MSDSTPQIAELISPHQRAPAVGVDALQAMVSDPLSASTLEADAAGAADRGAAALVLFVGGDVADAGVQPHGVVLDAHHGELGAQDGRDR